MGIFQWIKNRFKKPVEPKPEKSTPQSGYTYTKHKYSSPDFYPMPTRGDSITPLIAGAALGYLAGSHRSESDADYRSGTQSMLDREANQQPVVFDSSLGNSRLGSDLSSDGITSPIDSSSDTSFSSAYSSRDTDSSWSGSSSSSGSSWGSDSSSSSSSSDSSSSSSSDW